MGHPKRVTTETEAWCNRGKHMVPHDGFAKNQGTCKACRKEHYSRNNYSLGKACVDCGKAVSNRSTCCLKCRGVRQRSNPDNPSRTKNFHGYIVLGGQWDHPNTTRRGQLLEHVKVMSQMLGRPLLPGENVHHKNGVRHDNRPENLELWVVSQPKGQRPADLVAWAWEILERYDSEVAA